MGASILEHFSTLEDPRIERGKEHQLLDIVVLAICAVVCGAEGWEAIELFGRTQLSWLRDTCRWRMGSRRMTPWRGCYRGFRRMALSNVLRVG